MKKVRAKSNLLMGKATCPFLLVFNMDIVLLFVFQNT